MGVILAAICLQTRQESWSYPEAVAGSLFLVVGAVFPLSVLPGVLQAVGLLVPLTWWLEGTRRALFPGVVSAVGGPGPHGSHSLVRRYQDQRCSWSPC